MNFTRIPTPVPNMTIWGAARANHTFLISRDRENGEIRASVKTAGATPFDGGRLDLGTFTSIADAARACRDWKPT